MFRVRRWVVASLFAGVCLSATACTGRNPEASAAGSSESAQPKDIGAGLYPPAKMPELPAQAARAELIVLPNAVVQNDLRVQVSAQIDGLIEMIATPLAAGEQYNPADPEIVFHPRDLKKEKPYRRVREFDIVKKDQVLARLDEQLVSLQLDALKTQITATGRAIDAAKVAEDAQQDSVKLLEKIVGVAQAELLSQRSLTARYLENRIQSEKERAKLEGELRTTDAQLRRHWIVSPLNGRVVKVLKSPSEYARAGDPVIEIQATDRVRVEGKLDIQYDSVVKRGMRVVVEPARPSAHKFTNVHRQEVTGVAVTAHKGRPLVVSTGLDSSALVWEVYGKAQTHKLPHPTAVRAVAATGPQSKQHLVATGSDDGKVRLWDVSNPDKLPKETMGDLDASHGAAVTTAAFSPDGKYLATAAGRDVFVWDVAGRKKLYSLPVEHRDAVTTVRFTPQATLVTASRDKSIRVWELGTLAARTKSVIDHRGGAVDTLGVSADGAKVLFDKDAGRLDLVSLADERSLGQLQSAGSGARFATLALFSADDKSVLTVGGEADQKGEMTLWEAPLSGGRAAERRRLLTPKGAAVTCAAFSPDAEKPFVVAGTVEGGVHVWELTANEAESQQIIGTVVAVLPADAKSLTVRVEMANPVGASGGDGLKDRSLATIIINPDSQPALPVAPPPVRPAAAAGEPGVIIPAGGIAIPTPLPTGTVPPLTAPPAPIPAVPNLPEKDKK